MAAPRILLTSDALRRWAQRALILDDVDEPVRIEVLPTFLRLIRAAWDPPPMLADVVRAASRMSAEDVCRTCGGTHVVPAWVGEFLRYGQASMPTYGTALGMQPMACPASGAAVNVGTWSAPADDHAARDQCLLCSGTGLLPEWAAMVIEEGDREPRWLRERHLEGRYWFASHCRACGGWGHGGQMAATRFDAVHVTAASTGASLQAKGATRWFWYADPGGGWRVGFRAQERVLPELKGFARIAQLLSEPGRTFPVAEWASDEVGVHVEPVIDQKALNAARNRQKELEGEIAAAATRACREELQVELQKISDYVRQNSGLRGKPRMGKSVAKNVRDRENNSVRRALERLGELGHGDLATYLRETITVGNAFCFQPKEAEIWDVKQG